MTTQIDNWEGKKEFSKQFFQKIANSRDIDHKQTTLENAGKLYEDLVNFIEEQITLAKSEERKRVVEIIKSCKSTL